MRLHVLPKSVREMEAQATRREMTMEDSGLEEGTIVSFDIPREGNSRRIVIQRFLHGRTETTKVNGEERTYRYPGLLDEGGFRLGQSVYLFPPELASSVIVKMRELCIIHHYWDVMSQGQTL